MSPNAPISVLMLRVHSPSLSGLPLPVCGALTLCVRLPRLSSALSLSAVISVSLDEPSSFLLFFRLSLRLPPFFSTIFFPLNVKPSCPFREYPKNRSFRGAASLPNDLPGGAAFVTVQDFPLRLRVLIIASRKNHLLRSMKMYHLTSFIYLFF